MSEEKKELTPELKPKTNKSNIIKLVVFIGICIIAAVFLSKNKSKSTKSSRHPKTCGYYYGWEWEMGRGTRISSQRGA